MFGKIVSYLALSILTISTVLIVGVHYIYKPTTTGTLHLKHAGSELEIVREVETGIPHVFALDIKSAVYGQGFVHAQDRLWQMERQRRLVSGRLSELFGEAAISID
jgi:penicillin amidase